MANTLYKENDNRLGKNNSSIEQLNDVLKKMNSQDLKNDDSFLNDLDFQDLYKIVNVDLDLLPYSLPKGYSLKSEKKIIDSLIDANKLLEVNTHMSDIDEIANDWKKVGESLNNAIRKIGEKWSRESAGRKVTT